MMPEPDFDQIAQQLHYLITPLPRSVGKQEIVEALRQVWNARGLADIESMEPIVAKLGDTMDPDDAKDFVIEVVKRRDR